MQPGRRVAGEASAARRASAAQFRALRAGRVRLWVEPLLEEPARALGLLELGGLARGLARGGGPAGRGPTALLPLPGRSERLLLRGLRPGGVLAGLRGVTRLGLARPLAELRVAAALVAAGAPVARPALVLAERHGLGWRVAVGTLYEESTRNGVDFLTSRPVGPRLERGLTAAARALRRFHDAGGRHADLHAGNLLLRESGAGAEAILVDLDRVRLGRPPEARRRMAELMRLYRSLAKRGLLEALGGHGCRHFLRAYGDGDRALRSALLTHWPTERVRLRLHALAWHHSRRATAAASNPRSERGAPTRLESGPLSHWQGMGRF